MPHIHFLGSQSLSMKPTEGLSKQTKPISQSTASATAKVTAAFSGKPLVSQAHLSGLNFTYITSKDFCPASITCKAISHRAGFQTRFWLSGFAFINTQKFSTCLFSSPSYNYHSSAAIWFITPVSPLLWQTAAHQWGCQDQDLGKTSESLIQVNCINAQWWQCASANYLTANQFIRSTRPVCSSFQSSLGLQGPRLALLCCPDIWVAPSLLTVQFKETTKALINHIIQALIKMQWKTERETVV